MRNYQFDPGEATLPAEPTFTDIEELEARVDPTKIIGICRNPGEPFYWDADRIGEPCPDADCSRNAAVEGNRARHDYYVLAATTEASDEH